MGSLVFFSKIFVLLEIEVNSALLLQRRMNQTELPHVRPARRADYGLAAAPTGVGAIASAAGIGAGASGLAVGVTAGAGALYGSHLSRQEFRKGWAKGVLEANQKLKNHDEGKVNEWGWSKAAAGGAIDGAAAAAAVGTVVAAFCQAWPVAAGLFATCVCGGVTGTKLAFDGMSESVGYGYKIGYEWWASSLADDDEDGYRTIQQNRLLVALVYYRDRFESDDWDMLASVALSDGDGRNVEQRVEDHFKALHPEEKKLQKWMFSAYLKKGDKEGFGEEDGPGSPSYMGLAYF